MVLNHASKGGRSAFFALLALLVAFTGLFGTAALPARQAVAAGTAGPVVIVEDFEKGLEGQVRFDLRRSFSGSMSLESDPEYVRSGSHSVRLDYDFIGVKENPSYVYVGPSVYTIPIEGHPQKVGMWLYGNNDGHEIYTKFRDGNDKSFEVEYLDPAVGVNWTGWRYIESELPADKQGPFVMEIYMRIEQSDFNKKNKGTVWVDDVRLIYDDIEEDMQIPALQVLSPADGQTVTTDRPEIKLLASDDKSGIDPASVRMKLDGSVVQATYSAEMNVVSYMPQRLAGGYHSVHASVKDGAGNPAQQKWSFRIEGGPEYWLAGPAEVMSNKTFAVNLDVKNAQTVTGAYAKLKYDTDALELVEVQSSLPGERIVTNRIDNTNGLFEFRANQLSGDASETDRTLATMQFKVKASARMERGELAKAVSMIAGSLQDTSGADLQASAEPYRYTINFPYHMDVQGVSLNSVSTIKVMDEAGAPVQGASISTPDIFGPQGYLTVSAGEAIVYSKDKTSSPPLMTAVSGTKLLADAAAANESFYSVYLPDGSAKGWVLKTDADYKLLSEEMGTTDANGLIRTSHLTLALTSLKLQAVKGDQISKEIEMQVVPQLGDDLPAYVSLYVTANAKNSQTIVWQTAPRVEQTYIQYVKEAEFKGFDQPGITELAAASSLMLAPKNAGEIRHHQTLLQGLEPGTAYRYRVGYAGHWSAEQVFTTEPEQNSPFSFLFVTDSHTNSENGRNIYRKLMDNAFTSIPDTRFVMHGGDIVDDGGVMDEWTNFLMATESYSGRIPSAYTIGNHDVKNGGKAVYQSMFGLPENGMEGQHRLTYSYDYGDAHFVVLNSEADEIDMAKQAEWLRNDLSASKKKWKFASFHRTPYHTEFGRGDELVTRYIAPVLEELGVDLVLVGHDHALAWTWPMKQGKPLTDGSSGTVYLVGGASGWKFYDAYKYDYLEYLYDENVPVYSSISVNGDKLTIQARSENGEVLAEKSMEKKAKPEPKPEPEVPYYPGGESSAGVQQPGKTISEQELAKLAADKKAELVLEPDGGTVNLPIQAAKLLEGKPLTLRFGQDSVKLTPELLSGAAANGDWSFIRVMISRKQAKGKADNAAVQALETYKAAGDIIRIAVGTVNKKGEWKPLEEEAKIGLTLTALQGADLGLAGLYAVGASETPRYVRGERTGEAVQASVDANGEYELMEYHVSYVDVRAGYWASRIIAELSAQHLVEGTGKSRFAPERQVTRAEFVSMFARKLGLEAESGSTSGFGDVPADAWYAGAVAAARQMKLVEGTGAGDFRPDDLITRQEVTVIVVRAYERSNGELTTGSAEPFADMSQSSGWAVDAIRKAKQLGLVNGYEDGRFRPLGQATRAEAAKLVYLLKL